MKITNLFTLALLFFTNGFLQAQQSTANPENFTVFNREVTYEDGTIYLNAKANDGLLWLNNTNFKNGIIELDIKGKNAPGQSFVGVAFHGQDNQTFDAVYFRPFNFKNPQKNTHAIQYVSMPDKDWSTLRNDFPAKYESTIKPVPEKEDDWFHAKIVVDYPKVKVYVNGSDQPTLEVDQISDTKQGMVGLWVGNGSDGWFKNLKVKAHNSPSKRVLMDVSHSQRFYNDPARMEKDNDQLGRVRYMTDELLKNLGNLNAELSYTNGAIREEELEGCDLLFIHIPSAQYTPEEVKVVTNFLRKGGSLFMVMEVDYWTTLEKTNVNDMLKPFEISYTDEIPDSLSGGYTKAGILTKRPLKVTYHGGRKVQGGTPFCFPNQSEEYPFGVYKELAGGGKIIAMGDGMASLYMTNWDGVDGYECSEFMDQVFTWLIE